MFCAAIPVSVAVGARINQKQRQERQAAEQQSKPIPHTKLPAGPMTALAVAGLVTASVIYHSTLG
jgi:hypothetical protein